MNKDKISEPCFFRVSQNQMEVIQERFKEPNLFMMNTKHFLHAKRKNLQKKIHPPLERFHIAGAALRSLYPDGKFPSVNALFKQRDDLEKEFKAMYQKYKELKKESADLDKATQTIEDYFESTRGVQQHTRKKNELE